MLRTVAALTGLLAFAFAFADSGAQAAAPPQTLGVVLHHRHAATARLPYYRTAVPIAVNVGGFAHRLKTLTLTARGPGGEATTTALARTGNTFSGDLQLNEPGIWTIALSTQLGSMPSALASVTLDAVTPDATDLAIRFTFALSALSILAGLSLVLRVDGRPLIFAFAPTTRS